MEELIDAHPHLLNTPHPSTGLSSLHYAAAYGHLEVVRSLIAHGCDLFVVDNEGWSVLHSCIVEIPLEETNVKKMMRSISISPSQPIATRTTLPSHTFNPTLTFNTSFTSNTSTTSSASIASNHTSTSNTSTSSNISTSNTVNRTKNKRKMHLEVLNVLLERVSVAVLTLCTHDNENVEDLIKCDASNQPDAQVKLAIANACSRHAIKLSPSPKRSIPSTSTISLNDADSSSDDNC